MKLTRLEIKGFKSFCDKVVISFDEGVTAVAGPNGCGKSNIVDAIRWVLGEQSTRALRSEKMENVIFNGSKSRRASSLAEVSLSFDNSKRVLPVEYSDLTITRKLYRSGESEYRLNNVQCRLKDITDLFLDTGIGSDSYSIIELRMVEEIISNKEGSRRSLFEEASGISKYKVRKKQTFSKLRDTEEDLTRVEDLLFEIEKNLKTLEAQARRTQRYYLLKEQYRETSLLLAAHRLHSFRIKRDALEKEKLTLQDEKLGLSGTVSTLEASLERLKLDSVHKEKNLIFQQNTLHAFSAKIVEQENQQKIKNEKVRNLQEWKSRLEREQHEYEIRLLENGTQIKLLLEKRVPEAERLQFLEEKLPFLAEEVEQTRSGLGHNRADLAAVRLKINQHGTTKAELEKSIDRLQIQIETLETELSRNEVDRSTRLAELEAMGLQLEELDKVITVKVSLLHETTQKEEVLGQKITGFERLQQQIRESIQLANRKVDAKQNEYRLIKSLVDNLEGFPESIRFLKKNAPWLKEAPLLSDLIFCDEKYRVPVENFLEPYLNYYVVQSRNEALRAVQLLGAAEKGRANFFFLDAFSLQPEANTPVPEGCISMMDILEIEPRYRLLAAHLFDKVYLQQTAVPLLPEKQAYTLIDPLGRFVSSALHVSGGSVGLFEGKRIGRAKNLDFLKSEIQETEDLLKAHQTETERLGACLQQCRSEVVTLKSKPLTAELVTLGASRAGMQARKEQFEEFIQSNLQRKEDIAARLQEIRDQHGALQPQLRELKSCDTAFFEELNMLEKELQERSELLTDVSQRYNEQNIRFHQQQNTLSGIEKDLEYKEAAQQALEERQGKQVLELCLAQEKLEELMQYKEQADLLPDLYLQKEELEKGLREIETDYFKSKGEITQVEQQILDQRRKREYAELLSESLNEKLGTLKMELYGLKERLSVEFSFDLEELPLADSNAEPVAEEELKGRNEKFKGQIDTFGAINPLAMEAYKEIEERFQFIHTQKEDLVNARKSLLETIQEIDDTACIKFLESFNRIRDNFILVFRSLFNEEDSCDLILTDPASPLDSDIEILAMPKGKRPLSINQLSGGEKTLTATAILFSLYLLKPAPFCIFDEVDAPLDDSNIDKFNSIIRKFSDQSQFIVVSHNKRTIASTDVIYGITMVEAGISMVVPVDLRSVELADPEVS